MILNEFFDNNKKPLVVAESDTGDTPIDSMTVRELAEYLGVSEQQVAQDVEHARDMAREKAKDLVEEFDLIESIIDRLAEHNGVEAESIWEDLESLSNDELYVFAVTTPLMEDWQKVNKQDRTAGMSRKAVKAYRRENPGSKLKTAVTTKPSKLKRGSKASKRRKSYCSRSRGQMKMHSISCAKTPDKAICKARRRWNCESVDFNLSEMDKTQTSPGRDGDVDWTKKQIHLGPESIIKAKDIAKHGLKALDKAMKKSHADTPKKKGVAEAGPFSYGKAPRKGSVADLAAKKRKEQERSKQPVEPRDQQVGVAKITKGVGEAFGPLPKDNQQIRLGKYTVNIERVGLNKNYIRFAWHDSQGRKHSEEVPVGDLGSYDALEARIRGEISGVERRLRRKQGVAEGFDKNTVNDLLQRIRSGKTIVNLSTDDQQILMSVIDDAKQKLMSMLNSDSKLRIDWPQVKQYIDKYQSQISKASWDAWFKSSTIKQDSQQNKIYLDNDRLVVYPAMYNFLQWRFLITFLTNKINRNSFYKSDVDVLLKLKTLLGSNQTVSEQGMAEGSGNNNVIAQKIFFARSKIAPKAWSYDHVGFITKDGKQIQMSGHKGNDVYITNDVTDDPEFPQQQIKVVSLPKPVNVPTTNSVGAENCGTFVANVLQANGFKGFDTEKLYRVFKKPKQQGMAEGLDEFAPPGSGNNGDDGFSEETLKRLAAQWYNGDEDPRVERTLMAAGWEIGQDEGYDDEPGVFVVQSGDVNGHSYISWPAHELKQDMAEVSDATKQSYKSKAQAQVKALEPHAKKGEYRDIAQRAIDRRQRGLSRLASRADSAAAQTLAPQVSEGVTVPEGRAALGQANFVTVIGTYKRNEPFAELSFGNSGNLRINRQQMLLIMDHFRKLPTPEKKHDFVYETMSRMLKIIAMFDGYGIDVRSQIAVPPGQASPVPGAQPQLFELDAGKVKDTRLSRALKQARAEFPTAGSDIEAFLKLVMSNDDRDLATMNRMQAVNKKQSELLDRIQNIDQKQNQEIGNLESELDRVTQVNQNLERELNRIQSARPGAANREPRKDTEQKPAAEKPAAKVDLPVGQDISAKAAKKTKAAEPTKVSYGLTPQYKTTLQPPKYSMPQLQAPAQAQLPAPAQSQAVTKQSDLFPDITDVIPRAVAPVANGTRGNPVISALDQEITDIFQPAANDEESQRQANAESRDPRRAIAHTDFDSPEWDEKVRRVGQLAKQGPLKTVWDPVKRVYRNVPVDQPADKKPNRMTEARLHRRAVLRQILES